MAPLIPRHQRPCECWTEQSGTLGAQTALSSRSFQVTSDQESKKH